MSAPETLARRAALDLERSLSTHDPERATARRIYAGHWLVILRRHGMVPYKQWNRWLKETTGMGGEEARQLMSEFNSWQNANRFESAALKFTFRELTITGWKPEPGDSNEFTEAMQTAIETLTENLATTYEE
ncbi:hypothetical protein [Luteolibacter sp. Populi]|uniref:hypothetical protein n=1 Tax=Luteolibacter sp. Populi TaxID=3230487 RepID=UPI0034675DA3